jgi:hypothetical protein
VVFIILGSIAFVAYILRGLAPGNSRPVWEIILYAIFTLFDIACLIAIYNWKKWGVWGLCAAAIAGFMISIIQGQLVIISLLNLVISLGLLFWVLNIGGDNKGWPQLK